MIFIFIHALASSPEALATILVALVGWLVTSVWIIAVIHTKLSRCQKDIDGVAGVVGTKRAMGRISRELK